MGSRFAETTGLEGVRKPENVGASRRRARRRWLVGLVGLSIAAGVVFHRPLFLGNVGVVDPGLVYRSAQPKHDLHKLIQRFGLRSVLNLRGGSVGDSWYVSEVRDAEANGVDFLDYPMDARRRPSRSELINLLNILDACRYPLLIHCKSGSDRTGLAAALYLLMKRGLPPEKAAEAFTIVHGHVPIGGPERLHEPLDEYAARLAERGLSHDPSRFRKWLETEYSETRPEVVIAPTRPGPRARTTVK